MFRKWIISFFGVLAFSACSTKELTAPCPDPVISVALAPDTIYAGQSKTMAASWLPQGAEVTSVTWSSASPSIATVSTTGTITGVAVGETNVTVKVSCCNGTISKEATAKVVVRERPKLPTIIAVAPDTIRLFVGEKVFGKAVVSGEAGISLSSIWMTENPVVATVNVNTGEITGIAVGTAYVRACAVADMTKCGKIFVIVSEKAPMPTVTITATPSAFTVGGTVLIASTATGATSCTKFSNPTLSSWNGVSAANKIAIDSQSIGGLAVGTYTVGRTCVGPGGSSTATTTFVVTTAPTQNDPVNVTITATPSAFTVGGTVLIASTATGATSCTKFSNPTLSSWNGVSAANKIAIDSQSIGGLAVGTYTVGRTCVGPGGSSTATTTFVVTTAPTPSNPLTVRFAASKSQVVQGHEVWLSGEAIGVKSCFASTSPVFSGWSGTKPFAFSEAVSFDVPLGKYVVSYTCTNGVATATSSITIEVVEAVTPPPQHGWVKSITISPKTVTLEKGNTFSANVTVDADAGVTREFECESTNAAFVTVVRSGNTCVLNVIASPQADLRLQVIARTIGLARTIEGQMLPLEAGMLVTVKKAP